MTADPEMREWLSALLARSKSNPEMAPDWVEAIRTKGENLDDATLASIREVLDGRLKFNRLSDQAFDLYFDLLLSVAAGTEPN